MTRREWIAVAGVAPLLRGQAAQSTPVAIAKCASYEEDVTAKLGTLFGQLGGIERLVAGKTVTIKLNLTGSPGLRFQGKAPALTHYTHPKLAGAAAYLMGKAGAKRIRFVESAWASSGPLEEYLLDSGWNVRTLQNSAPGVEFENTNALGKARRYARLKAPGGGYIFPAYDLNHAYEETDVFVSMAKLKDHQVCGVTLSLKNCFGITPASIYGDDAGADEPNENPGKGRALVCHLGKRPPSKSAPQEVNPASSREPGYRMPRIVADLAGARPIHLAIIDGVESLAGGEGPWLSGLRAVRPGVIIAGLNPVATDAVAMAVMGYNPRAGRGTSPFRDCDNTLRLAEARGLGTADLRRIDVRGVAIADALYRYES